MTSNQEQSDEEYARQLQAQELGEMGIDARTPLMVGEGAAPGANLNVLNARVQEITTSWASVGLIIIFNMPQVLAAIIVLSLHWNDRAVCDYAHTVRWKTWASISAMRMTAYSAIVLFIHTFQPWLQQRPNYLAQAISFRNTIDAIGLIWFVVGNMWLFGDDDNSCRNPQASPVYNLCFAMLIINYLQFCLPCIIAILLIPVFCFCMPCLIRLLARLQHRGTVGASQDVINEIPTQTVEMTTFTAGSETTCPICLSEMAVGDTIRTMRCQHMFHQTCVDEWLRVNANCPTCRKRIDGVDEESEALHPTPSYASTTTSTHHNTTNTSGAATSTAVNSANTNTNSNTNNSNSSSGGSSGGGNNNNSNSNIILSSLFLRSSTDAAIR